MSITNPIVLKIIDLISNDFGSFAGSIIGVIGAIGVAKWQFKKQIKADKELSKEMFVRQHRIVELKKATFLYDQIDDKLIDIIRHNLNKPFHEVYYEELKEALEEIMRYSVEINCFEYLLEPFDKNDKFFLDNLDFGMEKKMDETYSNMIEELFNIQIKDFNGVEKALREYRKIINKRKIIIHHFIIFNNMCLSKLTTDDDLKNYVKNTIIRLSKTFMDIDEKL